MPYLNRIQLIGNLGANPEFKDLSNGRFVMNLRVATTERWGAGPSHARTDWHQVAYFTSSDKAIAYLRERLAKGSAVYVEGSVRFRIGTDSDGNERWLYEVHAADVQPLDRPEAPTARQSAERRAPSVPAANDTPIAPRPVSVSARPRSAAAS